MFNFDFRETNLKDIQKKAKLLTFSSGTYKGEASFGFKPVAINVYK